MGLRRDERGVGPAVDRRVAVLLVILLLVTAAGVFVVFTAGDANKPTAEGAFELRPTSTGIEVVATSVTQSVTVQLNGRDIHTLTESDIGQPVLLPTAPGDRVSIVSRTGNKTTLLEEVIDDRREVGDFVAYYTFESGIGTTILDRSGNGNNGTLRDDEGGPGPTWTSGNIRTGLQFDGSGDYVRVPDITTEEVDTVSDFTVATTVRIRGPTGDIQQFVEHRYGDNEWYLETTTTSGPYGVAYAVRFDDQVIRSAPTLRSRQTYALVGTYDSETDAYTLYIDGDRVASDTFDSDVRMGELILGRDYERSEQYFHGTMSQFRLYYTDFDDSEVRALTRVMNE
jgi:hypothetical protein